MKTYLIYIKSHCEAPDFEDEREFENIKEASKYWAEACSSEEGGDWGEKDVLPYIFCLDDGLEEMAVWDAKNLLKKKGYKIIKK